MLGLQVFAIYWFLSIKSLKVKLLAREQKATEFSFQDELVYLSSTGGYDLTDLTFCALWPLLARQNELSNRLCAVHGVSRKHGTHIFVQSVDFHWARMKAQLVLIACNKSCATP